MSELRSVKDPLPNADQYIPGFRVTFGELDRACEFLRDNGWSGFLTFDEAVRALVKRPLAKRGSG